MRAELPSNIIRSLPAYLPAESGQGRVDQLFAPGQEDDNPLRDYLKLVLKYRRLIGAAAALALLLALIYAFTATPYYTAESRLRISTYEPLLTATKIEDMLQEKSKEANYLETQIQEMTSYSLANKVLENEKIRQALFEKRGHGKPSRGLERASGLESDLGDYPAGYTSSIAEMKEYLQLIRINPIRRTSLVVIEATAKNPKLASLIANQHALTYIDWVRENRIGQQARGLAFLRAQADELREKVADLEREMADYAEANAIVAVNKDENITVQKMSQLNRLLTSAVAKRIEAENMHKEAEAALNNPSAGFDDPSTQTMRSELARLEAEYQQLSAKFMPGYPKMQQLSAQIAGLRRSIEGQRRQIVLGLKAKMQAAAQEEKNLSEELEQQKSQAFELSKRQVHFNVLNRELTTSRELLQNVLRQIKETSLAVESNASNVSIIDYAVAPRSPSFPRKKLILVLGLIAGLGAGLGLALVINCFDNSVRTPEEVIQLLRLPSLGVVPSFALGAGCAAGAGAKSESGGDKQAAARDLMLRTEYSPGLPVAYLSDPRSLAAEAYRTIRTAILLSQAGEPPRSILVSSAQSSEGKTTSSINLAACLASAGGRVVLLDADLRRPSMHSHFGLRNNEPGLVEIITGQCSLEEVAVREVIKRVTFIPSGKIPPNPAELLGSLEMAAIIDELGKAFDFVLIDSPPVLPVTDSVILSRYVDGVVLVVRGGSTPRKVIADAKERLQAVGARLLGVVLNDVDITGGDYYYYNRYYHSYYRDEESQERHASTPPAAEAG